MAHWSHFGGVRHSNHEHVSCFVYVSNAITFAQKVQTRDTEKGFWHTHMLHQCWLPYLQRGNQHYFATCLPPPHFIKSHSLTRSHALPKIPVSKTRRASIPCGPSISRLIEVTRKEGGYIKRTKLMILTLIRLGRTKLMGPDGPGAWPRGPGAPKPFVRKPRQRQRLWSLFRCELGIKSCTWPLKQTPFAMQLVALLSPTTGNALECPPVTHVSPTML